MIFFHLRDDLTSTFSHAGTKFIFRDAAGIQKIEKLSWAEWSAGRHGKKSVGGPEDGGSQQKRRREVFPAAPKR